MPKRVDHDQRRRHIAGALLRIAEQRGLQHASMREVAAEAEVSVRLVQYYFHTKDELLLAALGYLGEELGARVARRLENLGSPPPPRDVIHATLTAVLPTDAESVRLTRTYAAFYSLVLAEPQLTRHGAPQPDLLERFLANQLRAAQQTGVAHADLDPDLTASGLLALTNGLGSSVLGGQRDAEAALRVLTYHLDRLFVAEPPAAS
ncbi:TetR/AcrR family transcriptional regulator [Micromonospora globbae]|uniref:TetR family transcriptional regulator n=1 Tax=Micromonospora globbae TaxID=1894969 RepID=A0A420F7R8_9ACTN|nr:TetR/AcrR family transcriptional regulator [Micromonospora globbae]RKF28969.1 TetR family transcriptional regulator [Micromonospora globbae]WTF83691.1 TetR/AcrR family transcriptional regulator [Micromonospora globbae]